MNGQHLRVIPTEEVSKLVGEQWKNTGLLTESEGTFVEVSERVMFYNTRSMALLFDKF